MGLLGAGAGEAAGEDEEVSFLPRSRRITRYDKSIFCLFLT